MFLKDSNFIRFRDRYINNIIDCDKKIEYLLINPIVKDYILKNDTHDYSLLIKIANSNSKRLRDYYFSFKNVAFLVEKKKFWWIMDSAPFSVNKAQLLAKEYILEEIKDSTRNITTYILNSNCNKKIIDKMLNYYMRDIATNNKAIEGILASLDNEDYIFYVKKYKDIFEQYSKDNKDCSFKVLFGSYRGLEESFKIIEIFENVLEIKYSSVLIKQIIEDLPLYETTEEFIKYKNQLYKYILSCNKYLLDCIDSSYFIDKLLVNFGIEFIKKCFSYENILYLKEKGKLAYILKSKVNLEDILEPQQLAIVLDNSDLIEFHENIEFLVNKGINLISLLNSYFELDNVEACYKVLVCLSDQEQVEWFNNCDKNFLYMFKNFPIITKGFKKSLYNIYNDCISYNLQEFSIYELEKIISTFKDYSENQLIDILTDKSNMEKLLQSKFFARNFINILNLDIDKITKAYLSQSYQREIRNLKMLTKIFDGISYSYQLNCNCEELFTIEDNLEEIGEKTSYEYQEVLDLGYSLFKYSFDYRGFFFKISELKDKNSIIKILDYFLSNSKYLKAFQLASKNLDSEFLSKYYRMRKDLITKQINEGDLDLINNIFINLDKELLKREVTKDRERIIYSFTADELYRILVTELGGNYQINEQELDINRFVSIFQGWNNYYLTDGKFDSIVPNRDLRDKIIKEVKNHSTIQDDIFKRLQDNYNELLIYLKLIRFSSFEEELDNKEKNFLNDLCNVLVRNNYEVALIFKTKYKDMDIERFKLQILEKIKRKSRESILRSLTDLSKYEKEICVYKIGNKAFKIPTITFSGEAYNFLIRSVSNGDYFTNGKYKVKEESYSTIFEDNRSAYNGDANIKLGYSNVNPDDITYVYPFDAISNNFTKNKYYQQGLKCPAWLSADDLNRITKNNESYNEIRIEGPYFSDFVVSYDEPNDKTIEYADKNKNLLVKILRKSYPNSVENNKDPYHNVK